MLDLSEFDVAVLAAIAYHQPITRDGLNDISGKEISRDLIGRLHARDLIGTGPRSPRRGASYTFVTTEQFPFTFGLISLGDPPDREQFDDAGVAAEAPQIHFGQRFRHAKRECFHSATQIEDDPVNARSSRAVLMESS